MKLQSYVGIGKDLAMILIDCFRSGPHSGHRQSLTFSLALLFLGTLPLQAQWQTQTNVLQTGWNAVFLHVDPSHQTADELLLAETDIEEVWLWVPDMGNGQFYDDVQSPTDGDSSWLSWQRETYTEATLGTLIGNAAYLIKVTNSLSDGGTTFTWTVKGQPVPPSYSWNSDGQNFIGFSTPAATPPNFDDFLEHDTALYSASDIYIYVGGDLSDGTDGNSQNPQELASYLGPSVDRGRAMWIDTGDYNRYFGPFELKLQNSSGVHFRDFISSHTLTLQNLTDETNTVSLTLIGSEAAPDGQTAIAGTPPVIVRGDLDITNLTYAYTSLNDGAHSWTLAPHGETGSQVQFTLGIDRLSLSDLLGDYHAGILRFTDSSGLLEVDVPVSAEVASTTGLWVGEATVSQVQEDVNVYETEEVDGEVETVYDDDNNAILVSSSTNYSGVAKSFPLRLIVYVDDDGNPTLYQRAYYGLGTNLSAGVFFKQSDLHTDYLSSARRVSAIHLPWEADPAGWSLGTTFAQGSNMTAQVTIGYDNHASNPFVHTYHPDHDNLNADFDAKKSEGEESYRIVRTISLDLASSADDFKSLARAARSVTGSYAETLKLVGKDSQGREYNVAGAFALTRLTDH